MTLTMVEPVQSEQQMTIRQILTCANGVPIFGNDDQLAFNKLQLALSENRGFIARRIERQLDPEDQHLLDVAALIRFSSGHPGRTATFRLANGGVLSLIGKHECAFDVLQVENFVNKSAAGEAKLVNLKLGPIITGTKLNSSDDIEAFTSIWNTLFDLTAIGIDCLDTLSRDFGVFLPTLGIDGILVSDDVVA